MKTEVTFGPEMDRIVYVRPVDVAELPDEVRAEAGLTEQVFALHNAEGERLALVQNKQLAFHIARQNSYAPVSVH